MIKFSIRDNQGGGLNNLFSGVCGVKIYEILGVGFLIQRNDNRLLLYN